MKISYFFLVLFACIGSQHLSAQSFTRAEILSKDEKVQKRILESPDTRISDLISVDWQQKKASVGPEIRVISDSVFYRTGSTRKMHILQFPERYVVIPDAYFIRTAPQTKQ